MREIDEVRIMLLRLLSDTAQFPSALIDEILKASKFVMRHMASIKVNAYGRGLLTRYRQHSLYVKNFNRQANFQGRGCDIPPAFYWDDIEIKQEGIRALRKTRAYRASRRSLRTSMVDTSAGRAAFPFSDWSRAGPICMQDRAELLTVARTDWWNHRNRLGVKLLDFGEP